MIQYRFAKHLDLPQIAKIHKDQFPTHYLGQFSISLLEKFYQNLLDNECVFVVAEEDNCVLGFVLGGEWPKISGFLNSFMRKFFLRSLLESALRPSTWKKSIQKLISLFRHKAQDPNNLDNIESYTLLSIATDKNAQGRGVGTGLLIAFNNEMKKKTNRYYLSVQDENIRAISFYKKNGFEEAYRCPGEIQMIKTI
jgi:ribosomal protein S18 acetylase RimI-like enzyme